MVDVAQLTSVKNVRCISQLEIVGTINKTDKRKANCLVHKNDADEKEQIKKLKGDDELKINPSPVPKSLGALGALGALGETRNVIVLDLDRTLICSYVEPIPTIAEDFTIVTELEKTKYFIYKRPYLDNFLKRLSEKYDLIFWTAASKSYAQPIMDEIDPKGLVAHRLFHDSCTLPTDQQLSKAFFSKKKNRHEKQAELVAPSASILPKPIKEKKHRSRKQDNNHHLPFVAKDLRILNIPMDKIVLIDDIEMSAMFTPENYVPIGPFYGQVMTPNDTALFDLCELLCSPTNNWHLFCPVKT